MSRSLRLFFLAVVIGLAGRPLLAGPLPIPTDSSGKEPQVPTEFAFVRTFDADGYVERTSEHGLGSQSLRLRFRYLDPDVNAFVGMLTGVTHFNRDLYLGAPTAPDTSNMMWNWGGDFGIVRGIHLWELDLMGTVLSDRVGPAVAIVGEHHIAKDWVIYHRTEGNFFTGDTVLDADQGVYWTAWKWLGFSAGYRIFAAQHMSRSGPHLGIRLYFDNPKIPFIFPSIG